MDAMADNVIAVSGYDILPGQEKTVAVSLRNTDAVCAMQFDITLPDGLTVDAAAVKKSDRCPAELRIVRYAGNAEKYLVLIVSEDMKEILPLAAGADAAICTIPVKASADYSPFTNITLTNVKGANMDDIDIVKADEQDGEYHNAQVMPLVADDAESIKQEAGNKYKLVVLTEGTATAAGVSAKIDELNAKIAKQELTRSAAMEQLGNHIEYLEKKEGDVNLDGNFNSRDVQKLFNDLNNQDPGFDFNGDNKFNSRDVQELFNKLNNR